MNQGYSGSSVWREGPFVAKASSDQTFLEEPDRQRDLMALSRHLTLLPHIDRLDQGILYMEFVEGHEGLTEHNAQRAGMALRQLHARHDYPHPCTTGVWWLIHMANENLARVNSDYRVDADLETQYPDDALIHSEPVQFIERPDGTIVFIDIEGIGMGSRYHDLGFIYYTALLRDMPTLFDTFLRGYLSEHADIALPKVRQLAGVIALAYASFADADKRIRLGLGLLGEA